MEKVRSLVKQVMKEMSTSGGAGGYNTPFAFNPNKNAQGTSHNYYLKLGWKPVNKKQMRKQAKGMEYKDLWK